MPIAARPSSWIDWSEIFRETIPREWPKRLFGLGSEAYKDLVAFGETLALARDMLSVLQHNIWPALDVNDALFIDRWEEVFGLQPDGSNDVRTSRLIAVMRQRGTMTEDLVKAIMCRAWGSDDPSIVSLANPAAADVASVAPSEDWMWAQLQSQMYIYHTAETDLPNAGLISDLIIKNKPTFENWYYGQHFRLKWEGPPGGPGGGEGGWNQGCWS
jgi:hypothetical protein